MVSQCIIAAVAVIAEHDWLILVITVSGTLLALAAGALPQWRDEKWACRRLEDDGNHGMRSPKTIILTRGNGHRHVIVIVDSDGIGPNLEDLAAGRVQRRQSTLSAVLVLAVFWIIFLLMVGKLSRDSGHREPGHGTKPLYRRTLPGRWSFRNTS